MSGPIDIAQPKLQLKWAGNLEELIADLPRGWLKTRAQELCADANWPPEASPATIQCSSQEFAAGWADYQLETIGQHWPGRNAGRFPNYLPWPGCRFIRQLGKEQVVAVLQSWHLRSFCPSQEITVEMRWRPLNGPQGETRPIPPLSTQIIMVCHGHQDDPYHHT